MFDLTLTNGIKIKISRKKRLISSDYFTKYYNNIKKGKKLLKKASKTA